MKICLCSFQFWHCLCRQLLYPYLFSNLFECLPHSKDYDTKALLLWWRCQAFLQDTSPHQVHASSHCTIGLCKHTLHFTGSNGTHRLRVAIHNPNHHRTLICQVNKAYLFRGAGQTSQFLPHKLHCHSEGRWLVRHSDWLQSTLAISSSFLPGLWIRTGCFLGLREHTVCCRSLEWTFRLAVLEIQPSV